jgi:hypothetical protein
MFFQSFGDSAVVSHISRKTSEIWDTRGFVDGVEFDFQSWLRGNLFKDVRGASLRRFRPRYALANLGTRPISAGFVCACILVIVGYFSTYEHFASCPRHPGSAAA